MESISIRKRQWQSKGEVRTAYVVDYVDQHGRRRLKTFKLEKHAKAWATTALHEVASGVHAPDAKTTVDKVMEDWIAHCVDEGLERGTIEQRKVHLKLHIAPFIGRMKLADLTTPRINAFMDRLRDAGRTPIMRRKVLTSLSTALSFARGRGLVSQNVALGIRVRSDERSNGGPLKAGRDFPSKADLRLLIARAPDRWRAFIVTAIFTGMRASELRGLRWGDVDLTNATLHVSRRADRWGTMGPPKSAAGTRDIPLPPLVVNTLRAHESQSSSDLVFVNRRGRSVIPQCFHADVWQPLMQACGLNYTFHSLRHAAASLFIETLGWTPKRIQAVMGHSSITMTFDRYGHLFDSKTDEAAMKRLEAAVVAA